MAKLTPKKACRMAVDVALTVLIIASMLIQLTGETLHEVAGALLFVFVLVHIGLSFKWAKGTAKLAIAGKPNKRGRALGIVSALMGVDCLVLAASSAAISRLLAGVGLAPVLIDSTWLAIHTASAYALCVLVSVHLAMHWASLFSTSRIPYNPDRRKAISLGVNAVAAVGAGALLVQGARALDLVPGLSESAASEAQPEAAPSPEAASAERSGKGRHGKGAYRPGDGANAAEPGTSGPGSIGSGSSSSSSGICTLCGKRCSLSNPRCNKPYAAGLL